MAGRLVSWMVFGALALCGCHQQKAPGEEPTGDSGARTSGALKLDPGSPRLDFLKIEPVVESDSASMVALTGKVVFDEEHTQRVASPIDGRVTALLVKLGDPVQAKQPIIELSSPTVGQVLADAQKALSDQTLAQKAVERARKLRLDGAMSEREVAQAETDSQKARSDVARTSAQLRSLGISLSDPTPNGTLWAQVSGVVVERNVLVGQEVRADAAQPLLTITNLDTVWVNADVYEQDLGQVQDRATVSIRVPAYPDQTFPGTVAHIGDMVDPQTRTVKIRCTVPNPQHRLKPEMFAQVDVRSGSGNKVMLIPSKAAINEGQITKVIVVSDDHIFRLRRIYIGPQIDDKVRVLSGLSRNEKIVTDGALFLKQDIEGD